MNITATIGAIVVLTAGTIQAQGRVNARFSAQQSRQFKQNRAEARERYWSRKKFAELNLPAITGSGPYFSEPMPEREQFVFADEVPEVPEVPEVIERPFGIGDVELKVDPEPPSVQEPQKTVRSMLEPAAVKQSSIEETTSAISKGVNKRKSMTLDEENERLQWLFGLVAGALALLAVVAIGAKAFRMLAVVAAVSCGQLYAQEQAPAPQGLEPPDGWIDFIPQDAISGNSFAGIGKGVNARTFKLRGVRVQAAVGTPWHQQSNRGIAARNAVSRVMFSPITATCAIRVPQQPSFSPAGHLMVDMIVWTNEGWLDVASILKRRGLDELGADHEAWRVPYAARAVAGKPSGGFGSVARRKSISLPPVRSVDSPRMMLAAF